MRKKQAYDIFIMDKEGIITRMYCKTKTDLLSSISKTIETIEEGEWLEIAHSCVSDEEIELPR